ARDDCDPATPAEVFPRAARMVCPLLWGREFRHCLARERRYGTLSLALAAPACCRCRSAAHEKRCRSFAIAPVGAKHSLRADISRKPPQPGRLRRSGSCTNRGPGSRTGPSRTLRYCLDPDPRLLLVTVPQTPHVADNRRKPGGYICIRFSVRLRNSR